MAGSNYRADRLRADLLALRNRIDTGREATIRDVARQKDTQMAAYFQGKRDVYEEVQGFIAAIIEADTAKAVAETEGR